MNVQLLRLLEIFIFLTGICFLTSCDHNIPGSSRAEFRILTFMENPTGYKTIICSLSEFADLPTVTFNDSIFSDIYTPQDTTFYFSPVFASSDTLKYSISYSGETYNGQVFVGDTVSRIDCNNIPCKVTETAFDAPDYDSTCITSIPASSTYTLDFFDSARYDVQILHGSKHLDTVFFGRYLELPNDTSHRIDVLIGKVNGNLNGDSIPIFESQKMSIFQRCLSNVKTVHLHVSD